MGDKKVKIINGLNATLVPSMEKTSVVFGPNNFVVIGASERQAASMLHHILSAIVTNLNKKGITIQFAVFEGSQSIFILYKDWMYKFDFPSRFCPHDGPELDKYIADAQRSVEEQLREGAD